MTSKHRDFLENAACLALLTALAFAAFGPAWWGGQVPFSTDHAFSLVPWREAAPANLTDASAALSRAQAERYYPGYAFLGQSAARGDSMLWNPLEGCGIPFLAAWRTRCLSPFSLPFYVLPLPVALRVAALLKVIVAGWCAFYAARRLGLRAPCALFAAATFELGGAALLRTAAPVSDVVPWLPLLVLFGEQIASGHHRLWPFGSLVWALMLFGGDPEGAVAAAGILALYLVLRYAFERPGVAAVAGGLGAAAASLAMGAALAAIQIVPFLELHLHARSLGAVVEHPPLLWSDAAALLFPRFQAWPDAFGEAEAARAATLPLAHAGAVSGTLLLLWIAIRRFAGLRARARVEAFIWTALIATAIGVVARHVPVLRLLGTEHYWAANALLLGLTGAAAGELWLELNAKQCMAALPRFLLLWSLAAVVFAGLWVASIVAGAPDLRVGAGGTALAVGLALGVCALLGITLLYPSERRLGYGLFALAVAGLFWAFPGAVPFSDPGRLFPETRLIEVLRRTDQRIVGSDELAKWPLAANGIPQLYSSSGVELEWHAAFLERLRADPLLVRRAGSTALLLTKEDIQGPFAGIRNALIIATPEHVFDSGAVLFHDSQAQPRARTVYAGRTHAPNAPPVGADQAPLMESAVAPNHPPDPEARVVVLPPAENVRVRVRVEQTQPGVLVLADTWYPGWRVAVDGEEKEPFPVDLTFRGVALSEGAHEVEFLYDPLSVDLGAYISGAAGLLVTAALLVVALTRGVHAGDEA